MRFEVGLLQDTPEAGATHGPGLDAACAEDRPDVVQTPSGGGAMVTCRGFSVAIDSTSTRSEGGKAPRPTRPRRILQALRARAPDNGAPRRTVWRSQSISAATRRFDGWSGAATRRISRQRKAKAWGVEWARTSDSNWAPFLVRQRHWGSIRDWHRRNPCLESGKTAYRHACEDDHQSPALSRQKTGEGFTKWTSSSRSGGVGQTAPVTLVVLGSRRGFQADAAPALRLSLAPEILGPYVSKCA